jgi:hypothetical protein
MSPAALGNPPIVAYYIPIESLTIIPIHVNDLPCHSLERWVISDEIQGMRLLDIIKDGADSEFSGLMVRAMIVADDKVYYIDAYGTAFDGHRSYKIDKGAFKTFEKSLDRNQRSENLGRGCKDG